ncbi:MAG TPA: asparagine synthase-related protein [Thermoanaerobaculia bacterium]
MKDCSRLISWSRSAVPPRFSAGASTFTTAPLIWTSGFPVNRRELIGQAGLQADEPDHTLLLRLYELHGLETPHILAGPFAWVLWDPNQRHLVAVRDRVGVRTLFYTLQGREIRLAGKIEDLLASLPNRPGPNLRAVTAHIHGRVPSPEESFHAGIYSVRPGEILVIDRERIQARSYWQPEPQPLLRLSTDESYSAALRCQLLTVLPGYAPADSAGVALSGGMDSGTVASILREGAPKTSLAAFTWTAKELPQADESMDALAVCRKLSCPVITIAADQHWPLRREPGFRPSLETPLFNFYSDLWEATFQAAREHGVSVLFSGFGGDALFGGDAFSYPDLLLTARWHQLGREIQEHIPNSQLSLPRLIRQMVLGPIAKTYFGFRDRRPARVVPWLGKTLSAQDWEFSPDLPRNLMPGRRDRLRILRDPFLSTVSSLITRHADQFGIDFRHPLLDHRLIEFALSLPTSQTFSAGTRKKILRGALNDLLPAEVITRRGKVYPLAILHRGLRGREQTKVWSMMRDMRAADLGFVEPGPLRDEYKRYLDGKTESHLFWHTLTLEAWLRLYF